MLLSEWAKHPNEIISDGHFENLAKSNVQTVSKILSFLDDAKYLDEIYHNPNISCIICLPEFVEKLSQTVAGIMVCENPRIRFFAIHNELCDAEGYCPSSFNTIIGENCTISDKAYVAPINVEIGNNVIIEEFVSIRGHCKISNNTTIHSGCQIGGEGYEFVTARDNFFHVRHVGKVIINPYVHMWSNCSIHKAVYPWDSTVLGEHVQINANVHIDHGAKIGKRSKICAGSVICGRVDIDEQVYIGPNSVISNRVSVGKNAKASLGSVVTRDIPINQIVSGNFAINHDLFITDLKSKIISR